MMTPEIREQMKKKLLDTYENPGRKNFFYSANGKETASERLNSLPAWDWTPEPAGRPEGSTTHMWAVALGCKPKFTSEGKEWIEKLITDPKQVHDLEVPDVRAGRSKEVLGSLEQMVSELPEGRRVRQPDIQSPLGIAELMWDESFYLAFIEHPKELHELLEKITGFVIEFVKETRRVAGDRLTGCGFPSVWSDEKGTMIADDTMSLISPDMHREFSLPYVNRIAEEVGPLYYHSCTWRKDYFENIHSVKNLRAVNWNPGNSDDPAVLIPEFSGVAVLALHLVKDMHRDNDVLKLGKNFKDECAFLEYMIDCMQDNTSMYLWFSNIIEKGEMLEKIYDMLNERGFTPEAQGIV